MVYQAYHLKEFSKEGNVIEARPLIDIRRHRIALQSKEDFNEMLDLLFNSEVKIHLFNPKRLVISISDFKRDLIKEIEDKGGKVTLDDKQTIEDDGKA